MQVAPFNREVTKVRIGGWELGNMMGGAVRRDFRRGREWDGAGSLGFVDANYSICSG